MRSSLSHPARTFAAMGIFYEFTRVTDQVVAEIAADPDTVEDIIERSGGKRADVDKALQELQELLSRARVRVDVMMGEELAPTDAYELVSVWSAGEVAHSAEILAATPFEQLAEFVEDAEEAEYLRLNYAELVAFFVGAAEAGSGAVLTAS